MLNNFKIGSLSKKVGFVSLSKLFLSLTTFIINILFTRLLTKDLNGTYQQTILVINLFSMIFIFGVPTSIYYFFPRLNDAEKKSFLHQSIIILAFFGLLTGLILYLSSGFISQKFNNPELEYLLKISCFYLFFLLVSSFSDAIFITINKHKLMAILSIIFSLLHFCAVIIPVLINKPLSFIFALLALLSAIKFLVCIILSENLIKGESGGLIKTLFFQQLLYIFPLGLNSIIDVLSKELDRTLVSLIFNVEELANYHYGAIEIPLIGILIGSVTAVLIPELSKCKHENRWNDFAKLFRNATVKTAVILFPLFGFLMISAPLIFIFLFTESYLSGVPIFRTYLFMLPIRIVSFQAILFSLGKTRIVMFGGFLDLLLNFLLSIILVGYLGTIGIALGLVIATICQALFYLYIIKCSININWENLLDLKSFFRIVLSCFFASVPCIILQKTEFKIFYELVLSSIAYFVVYAVSLGYIFKR